VASPEATGTTGTARRRPGARAVDGVEALGRHTVRGIGEVGAAAWLLGEVVYWLGLGRRRGEPVRLAPVVAEMAEIGLRALPILTVLSATVGVTLAMQGIHTLRSFGAESQVTLGLALAVTREFAPLIAGILVAGRSGSALAARLATMTLHQEVDALRVMGVSPVRLLVVPSVVAAACMLPLLTLWAVVVAELAGGLFVAADLGMPLRVFAAETLRVLEPGDLAHGLGKSALFGLAIALIAAMNGAAAAGGAEGVGRCTTRTVVQCIAAILVTDALFVFVTAR